VSVWPFRRKLRWRVEYEGIERAVREQVARDIEEFGGQLIAAAEKEGDNDPGVKMLGMLFWHITVIARGGAANGD
jgi:hypothetical protein